MEQYREIIANLLKGFEASIPKDEPDREALISGFNTYLLGTSSQLLKNRHEHPLDTDDVIEQILVSRANNIIQSSLNSKKSALILDEKMEQLRNVSNKIFDQAVQKLNEQEVNVSVIDENYDTIINRLRQIVKDVKPFNSEQAKNLLSETILDIDYLSGNKKILSLRVGHLIKDKDTR